jgi:predicted CopG family antitoxin
METKRITVDLDTGLYEELRRLAYIEHRSVSEIVRMLLTQATVKEES